MTPPPPPHPPILCDALFMMDGCTFLGFNIIMTTIYWHYLSWKSQDNFLYLSDCICLKEAGQIQLGWLEGGHFYFWVNNPINNCIHYLLLLFIIISFTIYFIIIIKLLGK